MTPRILEGRLLEILKLGKYDAKIRTILSFVLLTNLQMCVLFYRNNLLWLHTVFAVIYLALTVVMLRVHTSQMKDLPKERVRLLSA